MVELFTHKDVYSSPAHIVITPTATSPSPVHRLSLSRCSSPAEQQDVHKQHAGLTVTTHKISSTSTRAPTLMPAPNHSAQHRLSLSGSTPQSNSAKSFSVTASQADSPSSTMTPTVASAPSISNGPVSRPVMVPARAKPGRKAMDNSEKEDRRRKQNRNAQRNYRDRRSQQVAELTDEVNELKQQSRDAHDQNLRELQRVLAEQQQLQSEMQKAEEDVQRWIDKANYFERAFAQVVASLPRDQRERFRELPLPQLQSQSQSSTQVTQAQAPLPDFSTVALPPISADEKMAEEVMPPTPPEDSPNETDFTQIWLHNRSVASSQPQSGAVAHGNGDGDDDLTMSCGFCGDSAYCPCKEAATSQPESAIELPPVSLDTTRATTGPGTCDMCQQDPARAEVCRNLAGRTQPSHSPPTSQIDRTMSCSRFIDRANNNLGRMPSIAEILGPLHSYPAAKGFDVNEQEAAVVLQRMATNPSP